MLGIRAPTTNHSGMPVGWVAVITGTILPPVLLTRAHVLRAVRAKVRVSKLQNLPEVRSALPALSERLNR
jgi:hypothetical protein